MLRNTRDVWKMFTPYILANLLPLRDFPHGFPITQMKGSRKIYQTIYSFLLLSVGSERLLATRAHQLFTTFQSILVLFMVHPMY